MTDHLAMLEQRVTALENEVAALKQARATLNSDGTSGGGDPADYVPMLRRARESQVTPDHMKRILAQMGITGEPIGAENVQRLMIEAGIDPRSNEFSRALIEARR